MVHSQSGLICGCEIELWATCESADAGSRRVVSHEGTSAGLHWVLSFIDGRETNAPAPDLALVSGTRHSGAPTFSAASVNSSIWSKFMYW